MPMKLLQWLARSPLPLTLTASPDIDKLRLLRAAGLVAVMLPGVQAASPFARVLAITRRGRVELRGSKPVAAKSSS
ncbi:MAG: hypothetical protein EOO32_01220 [Comamonadaceae bacterium]|nr:MAG: hypothetical protein EOO32_01220 [Comamonadaceae bacterium]